MIILQRTEHWLWPTQQAIRTNWYHHLNQASSPRSFHVDHQTKIEKPLSSDQKLGIPPPKKKGPKCFSGLFSRNKRGGGTDTSSHHQYRNVRARAPPASHRTDLVRESIPPSQKKWGAGGGGEVSDGKTLPQAFWLYLSAALDERRYKLVGTGSFLFLHRCIDIQLQLVWASCQIFFLKSCATQPNRHHRSWMGAQWRKNLWNGTLTNNFSSCTYTSHRATVVHQWLEQFTCIE